MANDNAVAHVAVTLDDRTGAWFGGKMNNIKVGLNTMGKSIVSRAKMTVPKKSGNLKKSDRVEVRGNVCIVSLGGGSIKYGDYQERGLRKDGTRVVKHYTTAGTHAQYLQQAGLSVVKEGLRKWLR